MHRSCQQHHSNAFENAEKFAEGLGRENLATTGVDATTAEAKPEEIAMLRAIIVMRLSRFLCHDVM